MESLLTKIVDQKRARVQQLKQSRPSIESALVKNMAPKPGTSRSFFDALNRPDRLNFVAEIKKASPSKGILRENFDPVEIAMDYESNGAVAISILTEEDYFLGSLEHLRQVRQLVSRPILRKDFLFDAYQIYEAAAAGADAVLLIVAILDRKTISELLDLAHRLGLDALVEVHSLDELKVALDCEARIIGVNNRDLKTFRVDLETSLHLAPHAPDSVVLVSESGINNADDIHKLRDVGYNAFLIGELFMKSKNPGKALRELTIRSLN